MKKRILSALLVFLLLVGILSGTALASGELGNFVKVSSYQSGRFSDVATAKWYAPYVQAAVEYGLVNGKTERTFEPNANLTLAEAVKLAACLHSIYHTGSAVFEQGTPWYKPYADYALENGIITEDYAQYKVPLTRSAFAMILSKVLPAEALSIKNNIEDNAIPDVPIGCSYGEAVYMLYRAGVVIGGDAEGAFLPNDSIKRSEVAAVVVRMANASFRQAVSLGLGLTSVQIYSKCAPAVFFMKVYDINGVMIKTGSGFFIDSNGLAVTNFHVIDGADKAVITASDGVECDVSGVYDYSQNQDLALLQIDGSDFPYLEQGDSGQVMTGAEVYAVGSPLGFQNSISKGIISAASRLINGETYIQTTAAISYGSSGGALLNKEGHVIGITTATAVGAQNINLAVPIDLVKQMDKTDLKTLHAILPDTKYYDGQYPAPDFGAFSHTPLFMAESTIDTSVHYYRISDLDIGIEAAFNGYAALLDRNCFSFYGYALNEDGIVTYYLNNAYSILLAYGETVVGGCPCVFVRIINIGY